MKHILHMYNSVHPNNLMERSSGASIAIELGNIVKKEEVSGVKVVAKQCVIVQLT